MTLKNSTVPPVLVYRFLCVVDVKRTHDLSRGAAADLPFEPRGQWDRQNTGCFTGNGLFEIYTIPLIFSVEFISITKSYVITCNFSLFV